MELISLIIIFVLALFIGYEIITKVPPTLHTPLMSGSNAISGVVIVGAIIIASNTHSAIATVFSVIGVILATINVVGGFLVTDRMLAMFKKSKKWGDFFVRNIIKYRKYSLSYISIFVHTWDKKISLPCYS